MAEVHKALKALAPTRPDDFPRSRSVLDVHLASSLADAHVLITSIPLPTSLPPSLALPDPPNADAAALQKEWKPVTLNSRDNALNFNVYKLPAKDGRGAWFARRSIHTDIPFARFKAGLQREFEQQQQQQQQQQAGGSGVGKRTPVRGIGKDASIHQEASDLGKAEVLVMSAQFPGPSAPRYFVEGYLSSAAHPEDLSLAMARGQDGLGDGDEVDARDRPKQFTIISRPILDHPDVPGKDGHVLGQYESVEFIRELPIIPKQIERSHSTPDVLSVEREASHSPGRRRGKTVAASAEEANQALERPPVEWIMITRSDPGGSVPRWMVERGTPGGIVKDAEKFLKWCREADHLDEVPESSVRAIEREQERGKEASKKPQFREQTRKQLRSQHGDSPSAAVARDHAEAILSSTGRDSEELLRHSSSAAGPADGTENVGFVSSTVRAVASGVASLATSAIPGGHPPPPYTPPGTVTPATAVFSREGTPDSSSSETASFNSFNTALSSESLTASAEQAPPTTDPAGPANARSHTNKKGPTAEERALKNFLAEKAKLEQRLKREEAKRLEKERKATEKHLRSLEKKERKYRRAVDRANEKRRRAEKRTAAGSSGGAHEGAKGDGWKEVEQLRGLVEALTKENLGLRRRVEELERERGN